MDLKGKTVVVSGGNSGLGWEISELILERKGKVIILGKNPKKVNGAAVVVCDLRDYDQIQKVKDQLVNADVLINCAGVIAYSPLETHDPKNIRDIIETNLLGTIYLTQAVLEKMLLKNSGTIINISSTTGLPTGGHPNQAVYAASKFGVYGFTESLKKEIDDRKKKAHRS